MRSLTDHADLLLDRVRQQAGLLGLPGRDDAALSGLTGAALLAERGGVEPGHSRILRCVDGWLAVTLAREEDRASVAAVTQNAAAGDAPADPAWAELSGWVSEQHVENAADRLLLLDIPHARVGRELVTGTGPARRAGPGAPGARVRSPVAAPPLVVDLSVLWAGPLCARLLGLAGCRVVKVEEPSRPDGARHGDAVFFERMHGGHDSVVASLEECRGLIAVADVVIDSSRPRALRRRGLVAEELAARGALWVSITAYGRTGSTAERPGFGADVAAGAGLLRWDRGSPHFWGDAVADPLTGLTAAAETLTALAAGSRGVLDVSLARVARCARSWTGGRPGIPPAAATGAGAPPGRVRAFGTDTHRWLW